MMSFLDVKHFKLTKEDEFVVLACDGIWNVMSSQECIDFVRDRLEKGMRITFYIYSCYFLFHFAPPPFAVFDHFFAK